ncbi:MAG: flagellar filament capping protein FliD [Sterolibacterium sp.]|nr:flagellar filament capping protein FliD [Sterolibacterium sp.]
MAGLASPGIGSGLDINGLVSKLMESESRPLVSLTTKEAGIQAKISAFGSIKSALSGLQTATQALTRAQTFTGTSATVTDSSVFTATGGKTATPGEYTISVSQLAQNHAIRSDSAYTTSDTFNAGTLTLAVNGKTTEVSIRSGENDTLAGIARSINEARAGVSAAVINTGSTQRLVLTSATTGTDGAIRLSVNETGSGATHSLTDFAYGGSDSPTMVQTQAANDAIFTINNIEITRSSNTVTDAIDGVTLGLSKLGETKLTVARDISGTTSAINAFVKAYNDVVTTLNRVSAYDAATKKASTLTGDSTVRSLGFQLSSLSSSVVGDMSGSTARLSDIGISRQLDGTLQVDDAKLKTALKDPDRDVAALFAGTEAGREGIAVRFVNALDGILGENGTLTSRTNGLSSSIKDIGRQRDSINLRLAATEANYRKQFQALDSMVSSMASTSNYLAQQLQGLANLNNN